MRQVEKIWLLYYGMLVAFLIGYFIFTGCVSRTAISSDTDAMQEVQENQTYVEVDERFERVAQHANDGKPKISPEWAEKRNMKTDSFAEKLQQ